MASDTIFDKIVARKMPATVVFENDAVLAFRDVNPVAPVHVLVIPKKKSQCFSDFTGLNAEEVGQFFRGVALAAKSLGLDGPGYRVVLNNGDHGGQSVDYLHAHILGGRPLTWPPG